MYFVDPTSDNWEMAKYSDQAQSCSLFRQQVAFSVKKNNILAHAYSWNSPQSGWRSSVSSADYHKVQ